MPIRRLQALRGAPLAHGRGAGRGRGLFVATLAARWNDHFLNGGWSRAFSRRRCCPALSYGLVACSWGLALHRAAGTWVAAGARIWFLSNLARYVPGNVWSYVGAVELACREGVARRTTLAVMALTQVLSVGVALLAGLPVLLAERARLGRPAPLGAVVVTAGAVLAAVFRHQPGRPAGACPGSTPPARPCRRPRWRGWWPATPSTGRSPAWPSPPWWPASTLTPADVPLVMAAYAAAYAAGFLALLTPAGLRPRGVPVVALAPVLPAGPALVVALLSRVWMMLVELAGRRGRPPGRPLPHPGVRRRRRAVLTVETWSHADIEGAASTPCGMRLGPHPGPQERFAAVFRERYRELHGLAYRLLGDHGEAEDVVQETFLRLDGQAVLERPDGEVAAWLRRVCLEHRLQPAPEPAPDHGPAGAGRAGRAGRRRGRRRREPAAGRAPGRAAAGCAPGPGRPARAAAVHAAAAPRRLLLRGDRRATLDLALGSVVPLARGERAFREAYLDSDDADPGAYDALP